MTCSSNHFGVDAVAINDGINGQFNTKVKITYCQIGCSRFKTGNNNNNNDIPTSKVNSYSWPETNFDFSTVNRYYP